MPEKEPQKSRESAQTRSVEGDSSQQYGTDPYAYSYGYDWMNPDGSQFDDGFGLYPYYDYAAPQLAGAEFQMSQFPYEEEELDIFHHPYHPHWPYSHPYYPPYQMPHWYPYRPWYPPHPPWRGPY